MSRNEEILQSIIDDTEYKEKPQSRVEELLLELKEVISDLREDKEEVEGGNSP